MNICVPQSLLQGVCPDGMLNVRKLLLLFKSALVEVCAEDAAPVLEDAVVFEF